MERYKLKVNNFLNRRFVKYGLPFFILIIGGSFGLEQFTRLRYQFSRKSVIRREDFEKEGIAIKKAGEVTLEQEYEKMKTADLDNWEQKRIPRPWSEEDSS